MDPLLDLDVDRAGGVVEDEHGRVDQQRPGDRHALALAARERVAAFADDGVVAVGEAHDELVGIGGLGRRDDLLHCRPRLAVGDVVPDGDREQERLVEDEADLGPQALERVLAHVAPVDQQLARGYVIGAVEQAPGGCLARPVRPTSATVSPGACGG